MRALWFANNSVGYPGARPDEGGGWMRGLADACRRVSGLELGISFFDKSGRPPVSDGNVSWFPVNRPGGFLRRVPRLFRYSAVDRDDCRLCESVIARFRPDVIHVFGTEQVFGLLCGTAGIPFVIHLQGLMGPCLNAWVPPGFSFFDCVWRGRTDPVSFARGAWALSVNRHAARREREIMRRGTAFMGRTDWDRAFVSLYAPGARYFPCGEALRPEFFAESHRTPPSRPTFVSTLSSPLYKGHDVVLKTAKVLCETGNLDFEWRVFGVPDFRFAEKKTGIRAADVNVRPFGRVSGETVRNELLACTAYVHPSYIDNSPNSICEAQVLGVPVLATDVGGVSSIVEDGKTGFLVPANDPLMTARRMLDMASGILRLPDGWEAGPRLRNDPDRVAGRVVEVYKEMLLLP